MPLLGAPIRRPGSPAMPAALFGLALILSGPAWGQAKECRLSPSPDGALRILRCDGFSVEYEPRANVSAPLSDSSGQTVRLSRGAALIEVTPGRTTPFRVITPRAIASVRGTKFAVDDHPTVTSVFVLDGRVDVRKRREGRVVPLDPGEGVDVDLGSSPLVVKRWPQPRADALLKRLGQ